ncbi:MAG TPA: 2-amino-4-hydroxy-6-hydroxymethyldihydropteridine diphosphokinase [bacterium]
MFLSLGSNLGDRQAMLEEALAALEASGDIRIAARSSLYETAPIGHEAQKRFLNQVVAVDTILPPDALLDLVHSVEAGLGRTREVRWGPRTIDIDILLYGDLTIRTSRLAVPHPELTRRRFVLEPLLEIAPSATLPDGRVVRDLMSGVADQDVRKVME